MKFKKMIFVLSITTFVIFLGMFGTSYAYYVSSGGTNVSASTPDFDPNVAVVFDQSEYINVRSGIPIFASDVDTYASKSTFTLIPDANILNNSQVAVYIKLVDVSIAEELKINDFKYKLVCNDGSSTSILSSGTGADVTSNTIELGTLSTSNSTFDVSKNYNCTFSVWLQESGSDQNDLMNKKFSGKLKVETMFKGGKAPKTGAQTITNLFSKTGTVTENPNSTTDSLTLDVDTNHQLIKDKAGNIRYYGTGITDTGGTYKEPDNYIDIGDRDSSNNPILWRIIGVFDGKLKLIRSTYITSDNNVSYFSWDTSASTVNSGYGINEWSQADLMKLLNPGYDSNQDLNRSGATITVNNSLWYNSQSGTCYNNNPNATTTCNFTSTGLSETVKDKIADVTWNTGGWITAQVYPNLIYDKERGTTVVVPGTTCSATYCNDTVTRTTSWTGKIGLAYPSDYGYATDLQECNQNLSNYDNAGTNNTYPCRGNNWMWRAMTGASTATSTSGTETAWLLTPGSGDAYLEWWVGTTGPVVSNVVYGSHAVSPVLYLNSEQVIKSGTGSSSNPYVIK